ncbi:hypothetical protein GFJ94_06805 [Flavobacterium sp. LMO8]|uniref:hypothetical protein n=1 Tax=Flavobacterium sp. LMO8 TaxID=2654244 RepID=UPI0012921010|nr:hypothetical protein [Flavobacterium sp. LMO8]MQP24772.1 hypothetical protein [Flavobacterium sp. LMO8]
MLDKHLIRFATLQDVDAIMTFINENWKEGHVLATNKSFFLYEYQCGERINFALAIDVADNKIVGLCGFIKNTEAYQNSCIWGSVWKVIKTDDPMLGIKILEYLHTQSECKIFSSCGIAPKTIPIYQFLRFKTGKLNHYYRLNDKETYKVAKIVSKEISEFKVNNEVSFKEFKTFSDLQAHFDIASFSNSLPYKDGWYIEKRYFKHPVYQYKVFGIDDNFGQIKSILIAREVGYNGVKVLRIVDFIGNYNQLAETGNAIQEIMHKNDYEYVDFYAGGFKLDAIEKAGFKLKTEADLNCIPNYFEPFVHENTTIHYFTTSEQDFLIFKGDGDQDRPNFIPQS